MKSRLAKKESSKNFEVLSANEMKQVEGGVRYVIVKNPDGSYDFLILA
jgi:bacteriocin-like protein